MRKFTSQPAKRFILGTLIVFSGLLFAAPLVASAVLSPGATAVPDETHRICYAYRDGGGVVVNECLSSPAACMGAPNHSGFPVLSECYEVMKPPASSMAPSDVDSSDAWYKKVGKKIWNVLKNPLVEAADALFGSILKGIAYVVFLVAGYFIQSMGVIMDLSIKVSIDSKLIGNLAFVNVGWTAVRDLSNMFFIFALLYIAIQTVLGLVGGSTKRWVAHIIIAAVLINFSLFFTKIVIDAGNVLATTFWEKLRVEQRDPGGGGPYYISSASAKFLPGFDLQTIFSNETRLGSGEKLSLSNTQWAMLYAGGAIFMFIAGYVFLAAAIMMVTRTIALLLLMVFSPFAFLSFGIPGMSGMGHEWLGRLIKQTFVAPIYIFMLYLDSVLIDSVDLMKLSGSNGETFSAALSGDPRSFAIIYNFILLIGFLIASIMIADKYAGGVGSGAKAWAKKAIGYATGGAVAGAAIGMRQYWGANAQQTLANKELQELAKQDNAAGARARQKLIIAQDRLNKSYDMRDSKIARGVSKVAGVDIGKAGQKGYAQTGSLRSQASSAIADSQATRIAQDVGAKVAGSKVGMALGLDKKIENRERMKARGFVGEDERKRIIDEADKNPAFKMNPQAKEQYLRERLGEMYVRDDRGRKSSEIDEKTGKKIHTKYAYDAAFENKEMRDRIARDSRISENKKMLEDKIKEEKENKEKLLHAQQIGDQAAIKTAEEAAKTIAEAIKEAMRPLNAQERADMLPVYINSKSFVENLDRGDINAIHSRVASNDSKYATVKILDDAGKESDTNIMDHIGNKIMASGNERVQKYILSAEGKRNLIYMDVDSLADENIARNLGRIKDTKKAHDQALVEEAKRQAEKTKQTTDEARHKANEAMI